MELFLHGSVYSLYVSTGDSSVEDLVAAAAAMTSLCFRVRCHIVHLSSAKALKLIQKARQAGAPLTVETTHHYLNLCAETIPAGATQFKCCPPIRGSANQVDGLVVLQIQRLCSMDTIQRNMVCVILSSAPSGAVVVCAEKWTD